MLQDFQRDLEQWEDADLELRKAYPVLNLFTHANIQELTREVSRSDLEALLHNAGFNLREQDLEKIQKDLKPPETLWGSAFRCLQHFSIQRLPPRVRQEASKLQQVATALPRLQCRTSGVPPYLKPGSPNLFLVQESRVIPSVLSMFHDIGSEPNARQVLICSGLPEKVQAEHLRLFLLRCLLTENCLHVLLLPENLSYSAQGYFLSMWRFLLQSLGASAGQRKYLLALVGSKKDCPLFDAFRVYQQDPPQLRIAQLRQQLEQCTLVWSKAPCAGKSKWIVQDVQRQGLERISVMLNEATRNADIISRLRECLPKRGRSALVLCPSPLVNSLDVDMLLFRLLVLRQLHHNDGKPFPLQPRDAVRLYLEIPNVLAETQKSLLSLGFSSLVRAHEARLDQIWDLNTGDLQTAARILRVFRSGGLLDPRLMNPVMNQPVGPTECKRLLEDEGPEGSDPAATSVKSICTCKELNRLYSSNWSRSQNPKMQILDDSCGYHVWGVSCPLCSRVVQHVQCSPTTLATVAVATQRGFQSAQPNPCGVPLQTLTGTGLSSPLAELVLAAALETLGNSRRSRPFLSALAGLGRKVGAETWYGNLKGFGSSSFQNQCTSIPAEPLQRLKSTHHLLAIRFSFLPPFFGLTI